MLRLTRRHRARTRVFELTATDHVAIGTHGIEDLIYIQIPGSESNPNTYSLTMDCDNAREVAARLLAAVDRGKIDRNAWISIE